MAAITGTRPPEPGRGGVEPAAEDMLAAAPTPDAEPTPPGAP